MMSTIDRNRNHVDFEIRNQDGIAFPISRPFWEESFIFCFENTILYLKSVHKFAKICQQSLPPMGASDNTGTNLTVFEGKRTISRISGAPKILKA